MTFIIEEKTDTASRLRQLEAEAPNPVPKTIRAAMVQAADELDGWREAAKDIAEQIEEISDVRISEMATASRVAEIQRQYKSQLCEMALRLRLML